MYVTASGIVAASFRIPTRIATTNAWCKSVVIATVSSGRSIRAQRLCGSRCGGGTPGGRVDHASMNAAFNSPFAKNSPYSMSSTSAKSSRHPVARFPARFSICSRAWALTSGCLSRLWCRYTAQLTLRWLILPSFVIPPFAYIHAHKLLRALMAAPRFVRRVWLWG